MAKLKKTINEQQSQLETLKEEISSLKRLVKSTIIKELIHEKDAYY